MGDRYPMDVAIFGPHRCGSTMLTGLLTWGQRTVYSEPGLGREWKWNEWEENVRKNERWGVKEVNPRKIRATLEHWTPKQVVVLVRNPRAIMLSVQDALRKGARWPRFERQWRRLPGYLHCTLEVLRNPKLTTKVVKYEELVASPKVRQDLGDWLDWPLNGNPDRFLRRGWEKAKHGGQVTQNSVLQRRSEWDNLDPKQWASLCENPAVQEFKQVFGYED